MRVIGRVRKLHVHQGSAAEVHAVRDAMPEQHGEYASHTEDEREGQKIPLLAQKIDAGIAKELQDELPCSKVSEVSRFQSFNVTSAMLANFLKL